MVAGLFVLGFAFLEAVNGTGSLGTPHNAMVQFKNDRVERLIALVTCEECILHDRNMAVWTLGQLTINAPCEPYAKAVGHGCFATTGQGPADRRSPKQSSG